ncbi:MAG: hypothetical protein WCE68_01790 [Anaerolineales bacterium]
MEDRNINATDMTRKIRDEFARRLAGKTHAERIAYYRRHAIKMEKKIPSLLDQLRQVNGNYSNEQLTLPVNQDTDTIANRIREKQPPYKKT